MQSKKIIYHLMALFTICIWGTTFVCTKILLDIFSPIEIMFYRFVITYITLLVIHPKHYRLSFKEESDLMILGLFGGSLYFLTENIALNLTLASHVGFLLATAPILTALIAHLFIADEKMLPNTWLGFGVAIIGVFLVIFNGSFILKLGGVGEILAILSALSWAFYTVRLKKFGQKYPPIVMTRKVFFYAIISIVPIMVFTDYSFDVSKFMNLSVVLNLLFLGVVASALCFVLWNVAIRNIGAVKTNNYIYLNPIVTLVASVWVLKESMTVYAVIGCMLILLGVYLAQNKPNQVFVLNRKWIFKQGE